MKVSDLKPNMMVIYKINYPDSKSYIGYSVDLKRRIWEHNNRRDLSRPIPKCD
jgi:predicted GIY-YIG superfamily endonuclease